MARNVDIATNNARFEAYPFDLRRDWWVPVQLAKLAAIASRLRPGERVLDVGCNSGYLVDFVPLGVELHGVDLSPELVAKAQLRLASAQVAPAEALPFEDKSFDVVTIAGVLEYVHDVEVALRELARVARRAIVAETNHEAGTWGAERVAAHPFMVRSFSEAAARAEFERVGRIAWAEIVYGEAGAPEHRLWEVAL